jgi:hypothetical protein
MKLVVTIIGIVLMISSISYAESPVVERPIYSSGDEWIFIIQGGKQTKIVFVREEDNKYIFSKKKNIYSNEGTEMIEDFELSLIKRKKHSGHPGPIFKFPLKVGKKWDYKFKTKGSIKFSILAKYKVEAYEQITVTAGTFWAFKILTSTDPIDPPYGAMIQTQRRYLWYSPEVKRIIKKSGERGEEYFELKEYKIN